MNTSGYFTLCLLLLSVSTAFADHVGVNVTGQRPTIALVVGPVANPVAGIANVNFDMSATPSLLGTGPQTSADVVLIEVGFRKSNSAPSMTVELDIDAPAALVSSAGDTILISELSWTVTVPAGSSHDATLPAGTFSAGNSVFSAITATSNPTVWIGGELTFHFTNNQVYSGGTYTGVVTYTAHIP